MKLEIHWREIPTGTMAVFHLSYWLFTLHLSFADVQFATHLSDTMDTPTFKKGASFVFTYQAVTSESESKFRVFSPFPNTPSINLTDVYSILRTKGNSNTIEGMDTVKLCGSQKMTELYHLLFDQLEEKLRLLEKEIQSVRNDQSRLLDIASSFLPPRVDPDTHPGIRNRRAVGLLMAAAGAAGLVLGDPVKNAAFSRFSTSAQTTESWKIMSTALWINKEVSRKLYNVYRQKLMKNFSCWDMK